jgi:hypothetical protein
VQVNAVPRWVNRAAWVGSVLLCVSSGTQVNKIRTACIICIYYIILCIIYYIILYYMHVHDFCYGMILYRLYAMPHATILST